MSIDKTVRMSLLFDFYGSLLTARQRECFELYYGDDLSLTEIAAELGVSRQAVADSLAKGAASLEAVESGAGALSRRERALDCARRLAAIAGGNPAERELLEISRLLRGDYIGV